MYDGTGMDFPEENRYFIMNKTEKCSQNHLKVDDKPIFSFLFYSQRDIKMRFIKNTGFSCRHYLATVCFYCHSALLFPLFLQYLYLEFQLTAVIVL